MSDYTKTTNFSAKDALPSGDSNKIVKGTEHDTEYDAIATAIATKANKVTGGTTNNMLKQGTGGDLADAGFLVDEFPIANVDLTGGTAETTVADDDEILIYDTSATANRKMTRRNFLDGIATDLLHITYQGGTSPGTATGGAWTTLPFNTTVATEISGGSRSGNTWILPAGTYYMEAINNAVPAAANGHQIRVYDVTGAAEFRLSLTGLGSVSALSYKFTTAGTKTFRLEMWVNVTSAAGTYVSPLNNIFREVLIWKLGD